MADYTLEALGLTRQFGGFLAVDGVDLRVATGSIHALIGPNGAGKTTCFNLLTKFLRPTRGVIRFEGRDVTGLNPAEVARAGLVRSFQISSVFPTLTALENVRLALQRGRGRGGNFDFWRSIRALGALDGRAHELLGEVGLEAFHDTPAALLPYGRKRALELATTLALEPRMLLLDEPTAGMPHDEVARIVALIRRVRRGRTILLVEHNLSVVEGLCDQITVMMRGRVLAQGDYAAISRDPAVMSAYLGSAPSAEIPGPAR
jgi:branched-chain amino acid transport system ATP-binding protein